MLPLEQPDRIHVAFDDHRLVANAGLLLPVTLARHLGLGELVDRHIDLGRAPGQLTVRADSGFYNHAIVAVCRKMDVRFSITIRQHQSVRNIIEDIPEADWTPIPYWMDGAADVADTEYTPFGSEPDAVPVRLIVRRVKPTPGSQLALFTNYSYHACITDREGNTLDLEADHRRHAEIENAIRDLKYGVGLNHLPSGRFAANAAWLAVQVMAHNLARWTTRIGLDEQLVTTKTLRRYSSGGTRRRGGSSPSPDGSPARPVASPSNSRQVGQRASLAACCPDHLAQRRHRGPPISPWRGYRTLHSAISIGSSPHRLFPLPPIPCLPYMATSLRWVRGLGLSVGLLLSDIQIISWLAGGRRSPSSNSVGRSVYPTSNFLLVGWEIGCGQEIIKHGAALSMEEPQSVRLKLVAQ